MVTEQRREEHTEVVHTNVPGDGAVLFANGPRSEVVTASGPAHTTAHQTETYSSDPYAIRRDNASRFQKVIYLLFGILGGLLAIRFLLPLLGANPAAGFARFIYRIMTPFMAPFVGLFGPSRFAGNVFEWNLLVAIIVYALIAWVLAKAVWLLLGDSRRGVHTMASQIDTRS